jgi:transcriptional regulator with XRE-family HTH domain
MKVANCLSPQHLLAELGAISYDSGVTDAEFWSRVVQQLVLGRHKKGIRSAHAVKAVGGPTQKTIEQIERGRIGRIDKLAQYADAVDLTLVDLFRAALDDRPDTSAELEEVIRNFGAATTEGRDAIRSTAKAVAKRVRVAETPDDHHAQPREKRRERTSAAKRREAK